MVADQALQTSTAASTSSPVGKIFNYKCIRLRNGNKMTVVLHAMLPLVGSLWDKAISHFPPAV